jgi:hypothetical protein
VGSAPSDHGGLLLHPLGRRSAPGAVVADPGNAVTRLFRGAFPVFVSSSAMIVIFTYAACFAVPNRSIASSRARSPSQ